MDGIPLTTAVQKIYRDSELIGFAVRATTKSKAYIVGRRADGKLHRITIGKTNEIAAAEARKKAQVLLAQIASGDIQKQKVTQQNNLTFSQAFELYLRHRKLKPKSVETYHHCINTFYLAGWISLSLILAKPRYLTAFLSLPNIAHHKPT